MFLSLLISCSTFFFPVLATDTHYDLTMNLLICWLSLFLQLAFWKQPSPGKMAISKPTYATEGLEKRRQEPPLNSRCATSRRKIGKTGGILKTELKSCLEEESVMLPMRIASCRDMLDRFGFRSAAEEKNREKTYLDSL